MDDRATRRRLWEHAAPGWLEAADTLARQTLPVSVALVEAIRPQPGHTVLELAAGTGDVGFMAGELVQPGGELLCTDWSPQMLSGAQERARRLGVEGVRFKQVDLDQPLDFAAASIDGVLCRWGLMLASDGEAALREIRRVLRPGGRLAFTAWAAPEENPWMAASALELRRRGLTDAPPPGGPGPFAWAQEGRIGALLDAAGFVESQVTALEWREVHADFDAYWRQQSQVSPSLSDALGRLDAAGQADVAASVRAALEPFAGVDGRLALPARTWVAVAEA